MYLKNVMNIYILHVCTFIFSCNYSWHCSCMYQMFICLYWNYKVKIIAFIGKKSEIKKNDQTKKKKKNLERQDRSLSRWRIPSFLYFSTIFSMPSINKSFIKRLLTKKIEFNTRTFLIILDIYWLTISWRRHLEVVKPVLVNSFAPKGRFSTNEP